MRIVWTEDNRLTPMGGHGVDFFTSDGVVSERLIAVVRGFEWLHGNPATVEVHIRPVGDGFEGAVLAEARSVIERYLRLREAVDGQLAPALYAHVNG